MFRTARLSTKRCFLSMFVNFKHRLHTESHERRNARCQSILTVNGNYGTQYLPKCGGFNSKQFSSVSMNKNIIIEVHTSDTERFLSKYNTVMLDCDGVFWRDDQRAPVPGIIEAMSKLRKLGKQILFVTNNSIPSRDVLTEKLHQHGVHASFDEVFNVSYAAALYLKNVAKVKRSIYAMGTPGLEYELKQLGLKYYGFGPELDEPTSDINTFLKVKFYDDVDAVLVGFDEYFNYMKLYKAASYLTNKSCLYVATDDLRGGVLIGPNRTVPLTASIVNAVTTTVKRTPTVIGKPYLHMYDCIKSVYPDIDKSRTLFIGDSVKADIGFAKTVGIDSAMVLTGSGTLTTVEANPGLEPDFLLESLAVLG